MFIKSLSILTRAVLSAVVLSAASSVANAASVNLPYADPFIGNTIDVKTLSGTSVPFVGAGPGGSTLYANNFYITDFALQSHVVSGGNITETYSANLSAELYTSGGVDTENSLSLSTGSTGGYVIEYLGRTGTQQTGQFTINMTEATFSRPGVALSLANVPTAIVTIAADPNIGYDISYQKAFIVDGQYSINGGPEHSVPELIDVNGPIPTPIPRVLIPMIPALLGVMGFRRRRAATLA